MAGDEDTIVKSAGIPSAIFVEDVESFMKQPQNDSAEVVLKRLEEQHQKYKFMEMNLMQKKRRLLGQIPDIKTTLDIVQHLQSKQGSEEEFSTQFLLSDQVYTKATILPSKKVCLWLGANVMLEYDLGEAESLLSRNLKAATESQTQVDADVDFLRDQYTTTEVNMARVYNWDVKRRQATGSK